MVTIGNDACVRPRLADTILVCCSGSVHVHGYHLSLIHLYYHQCIIVWEVCFHSAQNYRIVKGKSFLQERYVHAAVVRLPVLE